ncbi:GntR family transcriptional regulator [Paenibacillus thiaminolyticus]|uniref:GntR family transcriptional regulator n=1 Tax=Paenibacillus thiaminolyticus TaxID=49283 RepID=A0AAP9DRK9_PANTH|nr:GntR family transcriptional regulator [Paenibacillus thiaminolyticus]MCY9536025.1 GntR family transcriptional regulator [Paenibacillus thiaminolyticus]MCY9602314.1 GntR family transcriptional regulator [Paenibacillus thiaminolyticus]MCY9608709.1 GntR family transcriptional regulator [Paenibacillus thiaminolyticus]MCY9613455.1 GntR family transcriptional regulator [Paenibacillus thiaminolyticus]MCY9620274.1 GntR family transcriptional regulator [Paenibacillus thiaminolyticus]
MHYPQEWLQGASLGESIACELRLHIINGTVKPGEIISENRVAADFGTSRSPVREALKTLSNEGLIRLERMGAVVLGLSMKDVEELYDVRFLIESFVQQRLASADQERLIVKLNQIIDKMELAVKYRDVTDFAFQDLSFHEAIIAAAEHNRIMHLWTSIRQIVMTVMLITTEEIFSEGEDKLRTVIEKHRTIVQGLESKDANTIQQVVQAYFADSRRTLHISLPQ